MVFICFTFLSSKSQSDSLRDFNKFEYDAIVKKQKNAKVTAYIFTGAGIILTVVGLANGFSDAASYLFNRNYQSRNVLPLIYSGIGLTFASIPFYIRTIKLKHKAKLLLQRYPVAFWDLHNS